MQCATGYVFYRALFLGMGKIMCDPAPHVAHGRKTLQMCGSKIIPAFDLKGFMLVLGSIIRPCQLRYMVSKIIPAFDLKASCWY